MDSFQAHPATMRGRVRALLPIVALASLSACFTPSDRPIYLTDEQGRELVLHGVNISEAAKWDPLGLAWHTEADYARLAGWGFNAVRLLLFWSVLEPTQGNYDGAYLDAMEERLDWAADHGLMVILDFHQDLYGPAFTGDGAPAWATFDDGHEFTPVEPWWLNYLDPAVRAAFTHLYHDDWLTDAYADAWAHVAARFGSHPAVIGYDPMNEPYHANENLFTFEADVLLPFYQRVSEGIRSADPDATIFFEPVPFPTSSGLPSAMPVFGDANAVYTPHYYEPLVHEGSFYHQNAALLWSVIAHKGWEAEQHGVPLVLGEFGAQSGGLGHADYLRDLMTALDRFAAGWTIWSYDKGTSFALLDADGEETELLDAIVRPYPQRVAGEILRHRYFPDARILRLEYQTVAGVVAPTEIFVPKARLYPRGFSVESSDPDGAWSFEFDEAREVLRVWHDPAQAQHLVRVLPN
ncbi:MAG: cellulase family glycosylhydrolase [Planctomycetota bacterium]|jgi:endoglycosylceramidase|nr:cellulase family glycosylhydrolase [Planctomycetota bacterium]MDP6763470.1 cellulase family glycosylhydrolase [Planctomycetota bacterium]